MNEGVEYGDLVGSGRKEEIIMHGGGSSVGLPVDIENIPPIMEMLRSRKLMDVPLPRE